MDITPQTHPKPVPLFRNLAFKVGLVLIITLVLALSFLGYVLHARGFFESSHQFTLLTPDATGISVGMPLNRAGLPVGQVIRMNLTENGHVAVLIKVREQEARWLHTSSAFWLEKNLLGSVKIMVSSGNPGDPPLPEGAVRTLTGKDITQELPAIVARVNAILGNLETLSRPDAHLAQSLAHINTITTRMTGTRGVMGGLLGAEDAERVSVSLTRTETLLASLQGVSLKMDGVLSHTDQGVQRLVGILTEAQGSLKRVDDILAKAQVAASNTQEITADIRGSTRDLNRLRQEVDDSLLKVNHLIREVNRKWPLARDVEIRTP